MPKRNFKILWPVYFDKNISRSSGRRIPKHLAIDRPSLTTITEALDKLGIEYVVEKNKKHPSTWFEGSGRVLVKYSGSKTELLRKVAKMINKLPRKHSLRRA